MAGITLAIALRRKGLKPDIIERLPEWPTHGAGIYLVGNAMRALASLDLADEVLQHGSLIQTQTLMNDQGRKLAVIDTASVWATCGPCVGIRRANLQSILIKALGDAQVRFGTTVATLTEQLDGTVIQFSDGTEQVYDLVVGADGVRSSIRNHIFGELPARFCGQMAWRFAVPCPPSISGWTVFTASDRVFLFIPVGGRQAYCYADVMVTEPFNDPQEGRLERLRSRFSSFASPVPEALAALQPSDQIHFGAIEEILQEPFGKGQTLLIGDAAHATSPNMASGAAMAFEDALALSRLVSSERDMTQLHADYTAARINRIRWVHEQTHKRDKIRKLPSVVRDLMARLLAKKVYAANYAPLVAEL